MKRKAATTEAMEAEYHKTMDWIPEYWLSDLNSRGVLVHREPGPGGYSNVTAISGQTALSPLAFPDLSLAPDGVFPLRKADGQ